jgi:hypothetical protein
VALAAPGRAAEAAAELSAVYTRLDVAHATRILNAHQPAGSRSLLHTL